MKLTIPGPTLQRLIETVRPSAEREAEALVPLSAHVRLGALLADPMTATHPEEGTLEAATMSPGGAARASGPAVVEAAGSAAVSIRKMAETVKSLQGDRLRIHLDGAGSCLIITGSDGTVRLPVLPAGDIILDPWKTDVPETAAIITVDAQEFRSAILAVRHAASKDEARSSLCGVCLGIRPGDIFAVATDGARLAAAMVPGGLADAAVSSILPPAGVEAIAAALDGMTGRVQIDVHPDVIAVANKSISVRAVAVAGQFPDWRALVDRFGRGTMVTVAVDAVTACLRRSLAIAGPTVPVTLELADGRLAIEAESEEGRSDGVVLARGAGALQTVAVNPRLLLDAMDACTGSEAVLGVLMSGDPPTPFALDVRPAVSPDRLRCIITRVTK